MGVGIELRHRSFAVFQTPFRRYSNSGKKKLKVSRAGRLAIARAKKAWWANQKAGKWSPNPQSLGPVGELGRIWGGYGGCCARDASPPDGVCSD